jgi:hypothetical protein
VICSPLPSSASPELRAGKALEKNPAGKAQFPRPRGIPACTQEISLRENHSRMGSYSCRRFVVSLESKVPSLFSSTIPVRGETAMLRVGDSSEVRDVNSFFSNEVGIFSAVGPEGEDMIVMCPPGQPWFVRKSTYRPEGDSSEQSWHVTKLATWAVSRKGC